MPFFTCIVLSHNKPAYVADAIGSVAGQTFADWEAVVFDSGALFDQGFFRELPVMADPRVRLLRSWETAELRQTRTIASWCFNECFRKHLVRGQYVTYLCDDDVLYANAFHDFHRHIQDHPGTLAMYGAIDMTVINARGEQYFFQEMGAGEVRGQCCGGGRLDGHVDYLQLCHHVDVLKGFPTAEYWPEDRAVIRHADGVFMERIGSLVPLQPVPAKIGANRKVPESLNDGGETLNLLEKICRLKAENRRLRERLKAAERIPARYRIADRLNAALRRWPRIHRLGRKILLGKDARAVS